MKIKRLSKYIRRFRTASPIIVGTRNEITRLNWLEATLKKIPAGSRILDAGAGELAQKKYCVHLNYVSQDFAQYDGKGNGVGLQTQNWDNSKVDIISDITAIPEHDSTFDAIMCIEVFEHLPNPIAAIKEFSRLLKKDGTLIITAPFCSLTHFAPYHFYSGFNKYFYEKNLIDFGFRIEEIIPNGSFFEFVAQELQFRIPNSFTSEVISEIEKNALIIILEMLERMGKSDKGSSELLCFGYHVLARKK
jgi:SAM-dependent methyltransferase